MIKINKTERILAALRLEQPDQVPYIHNCIDKTIQEGLLGCEIFDPTVDGLNVTGWMGPPGVESEVNPLLTVTPQVARIMGLDAIGIQLVPPLFVESCILGGVKSIRKGLLDNPDALRKVILPDPDDPALYIKIKEMLTRYKEDFAAYCRIRLCMSSTIYSMGIDGLSYCLFDDIETLYGVMELYSNWSRKLCINLAEFDFDFFWCFDDLAFKTGPMFSPAVLRHHFLKHMKHAAEKINKPWIFHSDGNLLPVLDDLLTLGMNGLHPLEPDAMDLDYVKTKYGKHLCLVGNIDIDRILSRGTPEDVEHEVRDRIFQLGPGGGYIISDSNSIPAYCKIENVAAMARAVQKYRNIY